MYVISLRRANARGGCPPTGRTGGVFPPTNVQQFGLNSLRVLCLIDLRCRETPTRRAFRAPPSPPSAVEGELASLHREPLPAVKTFARLEQVARVAPGHLSIGKVAGVE